MPLTHHLSSILALPLVQLLSQPSSALQLLDDALLLSSNHHAARALLWQIQESCSHRKQLPASSSTSVPRSPGSLACMASSLRQYLHVHRHPSLAETWLEAAAERAGVAAGECERECLLVTALAMCVTDSPALLELVMRAVGSLAKTLPEMVSALLTN